MLFICACLIGSKIKFIINMKEYLNTSIDLLRQMDAIKSYNLVDVPLLSDTLFKIMNGVDVSTDF